MSKESPALSYRHRYRGLVGVKSRMPIKDMSVLSRIYTRGVGALCREIDQSPLRSGKIPSVTDQIDLRLHLVSR